MPASAANSRIDLEAVAALKPDLVLAWQSGNNLTQVEKLRALGLTVYVSQPNKMENVADQLIRMGQLAGTEAAANAAAEQFNKRLAGLRKANAGKAKIRVFYQIWKSPLMTVGGPQIISDAITLCGGENVFGHLSQMAPTVSVEAVLAADPGSHRRDRHGRCQAGMAARLGQMDAHDRGQTRQPVPHQSGHHAAPHAAHS